jgi:hypothetical protein
MAFSDPQQHLSQKEHKKGITVDRRTKGHGAFVPQSSRAFSTRWRQGIPSSIKV